MEERYSSPVTIRVLWVPDEPVEDRDPSLDGLARAVLEAFQRRVDRPLDRGLGIPVFLHRRPETVPLDARLNVVVVLVDAAMTLSRDWETCVADLVRRSQEDPRGSLILPVAIASSSFGFADLDKINFLRLFDVASERRALYLVRDVMHELCRILFEHRNRDDAFRGTPDETSPPPVCIFLSHAKGDGRELALWLQQKVQGTSRVKVFLDETDLAVGYHFPKELEQALGNGVLMVLLTDQFAGRPWCRWEILEAKRRGVPAVVVLALEQGEVRSFPYIGNTPNVIWRAEEEEPSRLRFLDRVLVACLRQAILFHWFHQRVASWKELHLLDEDAHPFPYPPELLTALYLERTRDADGDPPVYVYPDPPLGREELEALSMVQGELRFTTPLLALMHGTERPLEGMTVAISISDPPDLESLNLHEMHVEDAMLEVARYLLALGANLAYGGDLRPGGFTELLLALVQEHNQSDVATAARLRNYVAWPIHCTYSDDVRSEHRKRWDLVEVPPPEHLGLTPEQTRTFVPAKEKVEREGEQVERVLPANARLWHYSLTAMRERMVGEPDIQARVVLGGRFLGYSGGMPGVLQEVVLTLRAKKPLFVLGGFGGCGRAVASLLEKEQAPEFDEEYQRRTGGYSELLDLLAKDGTPVDYDGTCAEIQGAGYAGLNNALTEEDNRLLARTQLIDLAVALIVRGLRRLHKPRPGEAP